MYAMKWDFRNAGAVIKAHRDFRKMKRDYKEFPEKDIFKMIPGTNKSIFQLRITGKEVID